MVFESHRHIWGVDDIDQIDAQGNIQRTHITIHQEWEVPQMPIPGNFDWSSFVSMINTRTYLIDFKALFEIDSACQTVAKLKFNLLLFGLAS